MMRRKDREILDRGLIESVLEKAQVCRVAFSVDGQPFLVPLSFGYEDDALYFHCAPKGRKLDAIAANPRVCFEAEYGVELVRSEMPCNFTVHFASVIGFGRAALVTDAYFKARALDVIIRHYGAEPPQYSPGELDKLAVVKIEIDEMSCKKSPAPTPP